MKSKWYAWLAFIAALFISLVCCNGEPSPESMGVVQQAATTCVTIQRGTNGTVSDATVWANSTWPDGSNSVLWTGSTTLGNSRSLVKFDLSTIPSDAVVSSANVTMYVSAAKTTTIKVHRITAPWVESTVNWPIFNGAFDPTILTTFTSGIYGLRTFSLTSQVQAWVNGSQANNGFLLEEDTSTTSKTGYKSSESTTDRPKLVVCYDTAGTTASTTSSTTAATTGGSGGSGGSTTSSTSAATTAASTTASTTSSTTAATTSSTTTSSTSTGSGGTTVTTLAVIGDYGALGTGLTSVASMVAGWNPDHVLTVGDNVYDSANDPYATIIGTNYGSFITNNVSTNRFWPIPGNHDWDHTAANPLGPYLNFFTLPTNGASERYYHVFLDAANKVHLFALDADSREPNGNTSTSVQGAWAQAAMQADTTACFKIVDVHEPPYCSTIGASEGAFPATDWPYFTWGADLVQSGSRHGYERLSVNGHPYIVNGLGGGSLWGDWNIIDSHSVYRFPTTPQRYGAQKITITIGNGTGTLVNEFYGVGDTVPADTYTITKACN